MSLIRHSKEITNPISTLLHIKPHRRLRTPRLHRFQLKTWQRHRARDFGDHQGAVVFVDASHLNAEAFY